MIINSTIITRSPMRSHFLEEIKTVEQNTLSASQYVIHKYLS